VASSGVVSSSVINPLRKPTTLFGVFAKDSESGVHRPLSASSTSSVTSSTPTAHNNKQTKTAIIDLVDDTTLSTAYQSANTSTPITLSSGVKVLTHTSSSGKEVLEILDTDSDDEVNKGEKEVVVEDELANAMRVSLMEFRGALSAQSSSAAVVRTAPPPVPARYLATSSQAIQQETPVLNRSAHTAQPVTTTTTATMQQTAVTPTHSAPPQPSAQTSVTTPSAAVNTSNTSAEGGSDVKAKRKYTRKAKLDVAAPAATVPEVSTIL
jgi:hypothetical protein